MERAVGIVLSITIAILNSFHVMLGWLTNKPGEVFTGIAHSFADYFLYTAQMAQGSAGRWIWSEHMFTNEPTAPTWYYWFNVSLGHIGGWFRLSPFSTYNISLFILVMVLVLIWYYVVQTLYPKSSFLRFTTLLFILTVTNWYWNGQILGQFWFSPAPVFNRIGSVPYHVFQTIIFIALAILSSRPSSLIHNSLFIILSFLAGIANPIQMLLFVLDSFSIPAAVFGGLGAWMTRQEFLHQAVFASAARWELSQPVHQSIVLLLLSIGPALLFIPLGIGRAVQKIHPLGRLMLTWAVVSFALFLSPVPGIMGISPVRFLHQVPFAALAILAAEGIHRFKPRYRVLFVAVYLALTIPSLGAQFRWRSTPSGNPQLLMDTIYNHVPADVATALGFLKNQPDRLVVLTDPGIPIEVLVPAFTGKPSFSGHPIHTLYPDVKEKLRQDFFAGRMNPTQAAKFLSDHRIGYIINSRTLSGYQKRFSNATLSIYVP